MERLAAAPVDPNVSHHKLDPKPRHAPNDEEPVQAAEDADQELLYILLADLPHISPLS